MSLLLRRGLALLSGLLLWLSFPNPWALDFEPWTAGLAWVALLPLLAALDGAGERRAFGLGWLAGLACFLPGLFWLTNVKPLAFGAWPAWLALAAWCALFPALFAFAAEACLRRAWALPVLLLPALWTLTEWLRGWLLGGFPWIGLGSSQFSRPVVLSLAAAVGELGLHYAVALGSSLAYAALIRPTLLLGVWQSLSACAVALGLAYLAHTQMRAQGAWARERSGEGFKVAVVQGGIDFDQPWTQDYRRKLLNRYLHLSAQAVAAGARLVVWPESAFPGFFGEPAAQVETSAVRAWVQQRGVALLTGATLVVRGGFANAAQWIGPQGEAAYAKRHLVPFGEYVPLRGAVPLLDLALTRAGVVDFIPGQEPVRFQLGAFTVRPLICYESIFPDLAREGGPVDLLAILTVDTWYGRSAGPVWHASQALLRAVENGCWVARAASTGISLLAAPDGRLQSSVGLEEAGFLVHEVTPARTTPFQRWGHIPILTALLLVMGVSFGFRKRLSRA